MTRPLTSTQVHVTEPQFLLQAKKKAKCLVSYTAVMLTMHASSYLNKWTLCWLGAGQSCGRVLSDSCAYIAFC